MTETLRRLRGRPKGSEIDDRKVLYQIADLLVEGHCKTVAAAVRIVSGDDTSLIRRLQRKFRRDRAVLISAARKRAEETALKEGVRQDQIRRTTQPLHWRHEHDAEVQVLDALTLERQEMLRKIFRRPDPDRSY